MPMEEALISSADGDFGLMLIAFLVFSLIGAFLWGLRTITSQNQRFNDQIIMKMGEIVTTMQDYQEATMSAIREHDRHAECAKKGIEEIKITLQNRPCINGRK